MLTLTFIPHSDDCSVIVKTSLRDSVALQIEAQARFERELDILNGPLKDIEGVVQNIDQLSRLEFYPWCIEAAAYEHVFEDLYHLATERGTRCRVDKSRPLLGNF